MTVSGTNFGHAASDYGAYRVGFPDSIFDRLADFNIGQAGQTVIDLGTGTGTLARGFALRGCTVFGVDPDARMTGQAQELDQASAVNVTYVTATAESTGLSSSMADVVTAGQCWHWFDRPRAVEEVIRLLKPDGKVVIAHFDWLPLSENVVEATEQLIERFNPRWDMGGGSGVYPHWIPDLTAAGIRNIQTFSYDMDTPYSPAAWRGRIRASAGVVAMKPDVATAFEAELTNTLVERFPSSTLYVPHRVFAIVGETKEE